MYYQYDVVLLVVQPSNNYKDECHSPCPIIAENFYDAVSTTLELFEQENGKDWKVIDLLFLKRDPLHIFISDKMRKKIA